MTPTVIFVRILFLSGDSWMYAYQRTPVGNPYASPTYLVYMGYNPQESQG